jgi:hypothetical protein
MGRIIPYNEMEHKSHVPNHQPAQFPVIYLLKMVDLSIVMSQITIMAL